MAKFSKAHYVALAGVLRQAFIDSHDCRTPLYNYRNLLSKMLAKDNPKFDLGRFVQASEPERK